MSEKRAQASVEYLIVVGFVTFLVISVFVIAYTYMGVLRPKIQTNQIESFANKVISTAESVFYSGEPSRTSLETFLPQGVRNITFSGTEMILNYTTNSGNIVRAYSSKVNVTGSINPAAGTKRLILEAKSDHVEIRQA